MLNSNYAPEIATANEWIINHNTDAKLMAFLREMEDPRYTHGERWSKIFDWMLENYPGVTGTLVTGLAYFLEG